MSLLDASYRLLFSHRILLRDLLLAVVPADVLGRLDVGRAELVSPVYVGPALQLRQADLVWNVPIQEPLQGHVLIAIEQQSRPDACMALRTYTYGGLQLQAASRRQRAAQGLPILVSLVLYSGARPWHGARAVQRLFQAPFHPWLKRHIPRQGFLLVDFKKHALNGFLQEPNLFGLICRIQHNQGLAHVSGLLQTFMDVCSEPALQRDMAAWINQVILPRCLPKVDFPHHLHLKDVRTMLDDHSGSWLHQWEAQGLQKGLLQGRVQGLREGRAAERTKALARARQTLQRQLRHKFGRLPEVSRQQLSQAGHRQLSFWSLRLLDARSLEDVFQAQDGAATPEKR